VNSVSKLVVWAILLAAIVVPVLVASLSPLLAYRTPVYIVAGFAGILSLCVMLIQPLLAADLLPGVPIKRARGMHRIFGGALLVLVVAHIAGLWITSPPDVIDALLFSSPTPFSVWGVIAMWCVFVSAALAAFRFKFRLHMGLWRLSHRLLAALAVIGTVVHALKIEGAMGSISKIGLCLLVVLVSAFALLNGGAGWKKLGSKRIDS